MIAIEGEPARCFACGGQHVVKRRIGTGELYMVCDVAEPRHGRPPLAKPFPWPVLLGLLICAAALAAFMRLAWVLLFDSQAP